MSVKVAIVSAAHVHAPSFVTCLKNAGAEIVGVWDDDATRGQEFATKFGLAFVQDLDSLLDKSEVSVICSENLKHADHLQKCVERGQKILCEKPIAGNVDELNRIKSLAGKTLVATAFPCPFSPSFEAVLPRIQSGEIGKVLAINATNQGNCPGGWFTNPDASGGGAMIDHVVHVADLLRRILGENPSGVHAQVGTNRFEGASDDTAIVTVDFPSGVFASIDASWSKPTSYKTWGNVNLTIVGEKGVVELALFVQGLDVYSDPKGKHRHIGTGSNLDQMMINDFLLAVQTGSSPKSSLEDGLWASDIAIKAYQSVAAGGALVGV